MSKLTRTLCFGLVGVLLPLAALGAVAKKDEKKAEASPIIQAAERARAAQQDKDAVVLTNEDLDRLVGPAPPPRPEPEEATAEKPSAPADAPSDDPDAAASKEAAPKPEEDDPLEWMQARNAREAERQRLITEAEAKVAQAREQIAVIERRGLVASNPYLGSPKPPEDPAERRKWAGMDGAQRVEQSRADLQRAQESLRQAEADLARLRSEP